VTEAVPGAEPAKKTAKKAEIPEPPAAEVEEPQTVEEVAEDDEVPTAETEVEEAEPVEAEAEAVIAQSLERPVTQAFASFGPAVTAASIAQVHRGETERNGVRTQVAVKVLRPHVATRFRRDLGDFFFVAHNAEAHSGEARRLRLVEVINTMSRTVAMEMDLRLEAAALPEMAETTGDDPDFACPRSTGTAPRIMF